MSETIKYSLAAFLVAIVIGIAYGLFIYFEPVKDIATQKTDIKLTDMQILAEFNENNLFADSLYKNKIIEITGNVKKTEINDSTYNVVIDDGGNYIIIASCVEETKSKLALQKEGNTITLKGIYNGYVINDETFMIPAEIKIDRCTVLK